MEEKSQYIKVELDKTQTRELVDRNIKTVIINIIQIFRNVEKYLGIC